MIARKIVVAMALALTTPFVQSAAQGRASRTASDSLNPQAIQDSIMSFAVLKGTLDSRAQAIAGDTSVQGRAQWKVLQDSLAVATRILGGLQSELSQINTKAETTLTERIRTLNTQSKQLADQYAKATSDAQRLALRVEQDSIRFVKDSLDRKQREITLRELAIFRTRVHDWKSLGGLVSTVSLTAQQLLLFPEGDAGFLTRAQSATQWVSLATALYGGIISLKKDRVSTGVPISAAGLSVSAIIQKFAGSNSKLKEMATRVARNVGFTDEVNSLANLTPTFARDAEALMTELDSQGAEVTPTASQLNTYYKLVAEQRSIYAVVTLVQGKAQFLLDTFRAEMAPKSIESLQRLIHQAGRAANNWYSDEAILLEPYEFFQKQARGF